MKVYTVVGCFAKGEALVCGVFSSYTSARQRAEAVMDDVFTSSDAEFSEGKNPYVPMHCVEDVTGAYVKIICKDLDS
jgi:hypothetical protein